MIFTICRYPIPFPVLKVLFKLVVRIPGFHSGGPGMRIKILGVGALGKVENMEMLRFLCSLRTVMSKGL